MKVTHIEIPSTCPPQGIAERVLNRIDYKVLLGGKMGSNKIMDNPKDV